MIFWAFIRSRIRRTARFESWGKASLGVKTPLSLQSNIGRFLRKFWNILRKLIRSKPLILKINSQSCFCNLFILNTLRVTDLE